MKDYGWMRVDLNGNGKQWRFYFLKDEETVVFPIEEFEDHIENYNDVHKHELVEPESLWLNKKKPLNTPIPNISFPIGISEYEEYGKKDIIKWMKVDIDGNGERWRICFFRDEETVVFPVEEFEDHIEHYENAETHEAMSPLEIYSYLIDAPPTFSLDRFSW